MPAASRNALSEAFFKIHPWIYRKSAGRILGKFGDSPILLLNTVGRRTGQVRTNGLVYVDRGDSFLVAASWAGEPKHPIWYLNLKASPDVTVEVGGRKVAVRARELEGAERELAWQDIVAQDPGFAEYENRTLGIRKIPVILLEPRTPSKPPVYKLYGLSCSYFTGKLEAYLQAKGVPFQFIELDRSTFRDCAHETGVAQLPCIETPEGGWLTDTTPIIEHFEGSFREGPEIKPRDEAAAFVSYLFEDLFDEWFWRPALYYRWAFTEDATLMSRQLARTLLRDVPLPLFIRQKFVLYRQKIVYLKNDGVTRETSPSIEKLYTSTLAALNEVFSRRPYLLGDRPSEADYGLFGPFFRHFFCDPTAGALMRNTAPEVANWVMRMWCLRPEHLADTAPIDSIPDDLSFFFDMVSNEYLPYLTANSEAVFRGQDSVSYTANGVAWHLPSAPYRVTCLNELRKRFRSLDAEAASRVREILSAGAVDQLMAPLTPMQQREDAEVGVGRLGRPSSIFS